MYNYTLVSDILDSWMEPRTCSTASMASDGVAPNYKPSVVKPEAIQLVDRVCKEIRGVKSHPRNSGSAWIYRDDCPYVLGWVGFGVSTGHGTEMYYVQSRTISNAKFSEASDQHFMKQTSKVDVAVRNAKTFLRMMSPLELAKTRLDRVQILVSSALATARQELAGSRREVLVGCGIDVQNELRHLLRTDHEFIDAAFKEGIATFFDRQDEVTRLKKRKVLMSFVHVHKRMGAQVFDVVDIGDPLDDRVIYPAALHSNTSLKHLWDVIRYTGDTLPESIMQKLSVLNILEDDDYVDGVGYSAGDGMFYVTQS